MRLLQINTVTNSKEDLLCTGTKIPNQKTNEDWLKRVLVPRDVNIFLNLKKNVELIWATWACLFICFCAFNSFIYDIIMTDKSKTSLVALGFFGVATFFVLIAFVSPYWLVTDGKLPHPKFIKIGLWEVCFNGFEEVHHWYDTVFKGCWWIFEEEYYIIHDILLPGFFVATQFFFTVTFLCVLISLFLSFLFWRKDKDDEHYVTLLITLGTVLSMGGFSGIISVVTFGARGDGREWMPNWEHNDLGWAFALGVVGVIFLFPAGILFLVEARVQKYKKLHNMQSREPSSYTMQERKLAYSGGHTDI